MKTRVPQVSVLDQELFGIYTAGLHYLLHPLNVSFHCHSDNTQNHMTIDESPKSQEKLTLIYEAVNHWMKA